MPLFSESEMGEFRSQWSKMQTGFVDEPRRTVEDADKLVAAVLQRLADGFANERSGLEKWWDSGDNVSTEDLRVALQRCSRLADDSLAPVVLSLSPIAAVDPARAFRFEGGTSSFNLWFDSAV
jgi:hypothetical protein